MSEAPEHVVVIAWRSVDARAVLTHEEFMIAAEREYVRALLALTSNNVTSAAKLAGHNRSAMYSIFRRVGRYCRPRARGAWERSLPECEQR